MGMPQEISQDVRAAVPASGDTSKVVALSAAEEVISVIESGLDDLKKASPADLVAAIDALRSNAAGLKQQMAATAVVAFKRADEEVEITEAPALLLRNSSDYKPGEWDPDKGGIFIGEFDLADANDKRLDVRTRWYDAAIELGKPMTFNDTATAVAGHNENGRGDLHLDAARYEAELFEKLNTGDALGKHVIAPLQVVKAIYGLKNTGEYRRRSEAFLPGKLITAATGTGNIIWQWSCTPHRRYPGGVRAVVFSGGSDDWRNRDGGRLSGRVCFAELAP